MNPPADDGAFARWLASRAGDALVAIRGRGFADAEALKAAGDKGSHDLILTELARWRPGDGVLSEEGARTDPTRQGADRVWIVDPLDGTREFAEEGRADWAVHIGLWARGTGSRGALAAGAVALPALRRVLATDDPPPYPPPAPDGVIRIAVSRTRPPALVVAVADALGATLVPMGSAGAKIVAVVDGEVDAYVHGGGQYEWDSAAPVAVATATGLHASRLDGSTLEYNQVDPTLPDLVVCRPELAPALLAAIGAAIGAPVGDDTGRPD